MGEVYRATDTNLKRAVAIKVLPDAVAGDAERLARFQREAEVLAALNHPNIAAIYRLERAGAVFALVMELVEGPTLADRIDLGAIGIDEALPIARQIVEALEAAHEQGIIHRDLKPSNIKLRPDGTVKVLDFGLAKAMDTPLGVLSSVSMSPTMTTPAMTHAGIIMGTAAYMSPEQAKGKPADRRADIWAFGVVLYEMVTGQRLFTGETAAEILAGVIKDEPRLDTLPAGVRPIVDRCLRRDPRKRWQAIGDVRIALEEGPAAAATEPASLPSRFWREATLAWIVASMAIAGAAGFRSFTLAKRRQDSPARASKWRGRRSWRLRASRFLLTDGMSPSSPAKPAVGCGFGPSIRSTLGRCREPMERCLART